MKKITFLFISFILFIPSIWAQSQIIFAGKITNYAKNKKFLANNKPINLNEKGEFKEAIKFRRSGSGDWYINYEDLNIKLYEEPNDSLYLIADANNFEKTAKFSGKGTVGNHNNFMLNLVRLPSQLNIFEEQTWVTDKSVEEYVTASDKIYEERHNALKQFLKKNKVSDDFKNFAEAELMYALANERIIYKDAKTSILGNFPPSYYTYEKNLIINNPKAINPENRHYLDFLGFYTNQLFINKIVKIDSNYFKQTEVQKIFMDKYQVSKEHFSGSPLGYIAYTILKEAYSMRIVSGLESIYQDFKANVPDKKYLTEIDNMLASAKMFSTGNIAPNFTLKDSTGRDITLTDFKGKIVVIDFWASWCGPCMQELPHVKEIKAQLKAKGLDKEIVFLYISIDENRKNWLKAIKTKEIEGTHIIAPEGWKAEVLKLYQTTSIPAYFIIDKEGKFALDYLNRPSSGKMLADIEKVSKR